MRAITSLSLGGGPGRKGAGRERYVCEVMTDSPHVYWRMAETEGTRAYAISRRRFEGTYHGSPTMGVEGALGGGDKALDLTQADMGNFTAGSLNELGTNLDAGFSFECFFKDTSGYEPTWGALMFGWTAVGGVYPNTYLSITIGNDENSTPMPNAIRAQLHYSIGASSAAPTTLMLSGAAAFDTGVRDGNWHHIVVTADPTTNTLHIYVDSADLAITYQRQETPTGWAPFTDGIGIGSAVTVPSLNAGGYMDEVAVYNHVLTGARVLAHYRAAGMRGTVGPFTRLSTTATPGREYEEGFDGKDSNPPQFVEVARGAHQAAWLVSEVARGAHETGAPFVEVARGFHSCTITIFEELARGMHRVANDANTRWEVFKGEDAQPDFDAAAWETFTSLPHTSTGTIANPGAGNVKVVNLVVRKRNAYGLSSYNVVALTFTIDENGAEVAIDPSDPTNIVVEPAAAGEVRVRAEYQYLADLAANRADNFLVYLTTNGVDPVPGSDTPTEVAMIFSDGTAKLDWTSSVTPGDAATAKVIVQCRNSGTPDLDSDDATIYTCTTDTDGPATPSPAGAFFVASGTNTGEQAQ